MVKKNKNKTHTHTHTHTEATTGCDNSVDESVNEQHTLTFKKKTTKVENKKKKAVGYLGIVPAAALA